MKWPLVIFAMVAGGAMVHFIHGLTDPAPTIRTDLQVYRDVETGCEYIKTVWGLGALTPRNDSLGVPICRDEGVSEEVEKLLDEVGNGPAGAPSNPEAPGTSNSVR